MPTAIPTELLDDSSAGLRPLKILQLVSGTDVNGALVHCRLLARELAKRGHLVSIGCRAGSWLWNQMDDSSVRLITCDMKRRPVSRMQSFADWIRREKFDVMQTHMSSANLFGVLMKQMTGVPVVATAHSRHIQPHWRFNDHVIANSAVTQRYMRRVNRVNPQRLTTVHCFVDDEKFREQETIIYRGLRRQWRFQLDARVVVIAGDVVPHKGHWYFFQCLPDLLKRFPDLQVVVVGRFKRDEKYTQKLRRFLLQHRILNRVKWIGRRNNMQEVLSAADLAVIPSLVESLGMVALECMAVGTPVVASRTGGLIELIENEQNGLLVPAKNPQAIGQAVTRLLKCEQLQTELVAGGKSVVATRFSTDVLVRQVEAVLRQTAGRVADVEDRSCSSSAA